MIALNLTARHIALWLEQDPAAPDRPETAMHVGARLCFLHDLHVWLQRRARDGGSEVYLLRRAIVFCEQAVRQYMREDKFLLRQMSSKWGMTAVEAAGRSASNIKAYYAEQAQVMSILFEFELAKRIREIEKNEKDGCL